MSPSQLPCTASSKKASIGEVSPSSLWSCERVGVFVRLRGRDVRAFSQDKGCGVLDRYAYRSKRDRCRHFAPRPATYQGDGELEFAGYRREGLAEEGASCAGMCGMVRKEAY
jgi:hypothetical protein